MMADSVGVSTAIGYKVTCVTVAINGTALMRCNQTDVLELAQRKYLNLQRIDLRPFV
jgi:hypothetical protein